MKENKIKDCIYLKFGECEGQDASTCTLYDIFRGNGHTKCCLECQLICLGMCEVALGEKADRIITMAKNIWRGR